MATSRVKGLRTLLSRRQMGSSSWVMRHGGGVLLLPEILRATPETGSHVVAYLRRFSSSNIMEALENCGCEVRIYGLGARPSAGNLRFRDVDMFRFVEDLATSRALVSTAGNQLFGEAL